MVRQWQTLFYDAAIQHSLQRKTDFVALADAGARLPAHDLDSLNAALDAALALSGRASTWLLIRYKVLPMIRRTINDIIQRIGTWTRQFFGRPCGQRRGATPCPTRIQH